MAMKISREIWNDYSFSAWMSGFVISIVVLIIPDKAYSNILSWLLLPYFMWGTIYWYNWAMNQQKYIPYAYWIGIFGFIMPYAAVFPLMGKYKSSRHSVVHRNVNNGVNATKKVVKLPTNKLALAVLLCVVFTHALFLLNKTYNGMSREQFGYRAIHKTTYIAYFNFFPLWSVNIFYCIYFIYAMLILFGVVKLNIREERKAT